MNRMTVEEAIKLSGDLAEKIKRDFTPDVIVTIREGGILPGIEISKFLNRPLHAITIGRVSEKSFAKEYGETSAEGRKEISKKFDELWFQTNPKLTSGVDLDLAGKSLLLVDDAAHTGKTFDVAKQYLQTFSPSTIRTAALYHVDLYVPDYSLGQRGARYPWSSWAGFEKEYEPYAAYLKENASLIS